MTDRELLEFAALAAGIEQNSRPFFTNGLTQNVRGGVRCWNPLADDGDALRRAVKLYLWDAVRLAHREVSDTVDIYAATRRAIVRAAAEIGKSMSGQSNHPAKVA